MMRRTDKSKKTRPKGKVRVIRPPHDEGPDLEEDTSPESKQPVTDPSFNIYQNADTNIELFVETLHGEYKIRSSIERVIDYIEDKVKEPSNKITSYVLFVKKLFKDKSFKHANTLLAEAMSKHKDTPQLIVEYAKLKFVTQLYSEAADYFGVALKFKSIDYDQTVYNLALSYLQMEKPDLAIPHFQNVLAKKPDHLGAIVNLGVAYKKLHKKEEALAYYNQALALEPNDHEILANIGSLYYDQENYEKAVEYFLKALQIKEDDVETLNNLGNGLTKLKDYSTAWIAFEHALKIAPGNSTVIENYALCLLEAKRFDAFEAIMEKFVYLAKDKREKLEKIADDYRNVLGIRTKKQRRAKGKGKQRSIAALGRSGLSSGDLSKKGSFIAKGTELSSVEEEKEGM